MGAQELPVHICGLCLKEERPIHNVTQADGLIYKMSKGVLSQKERIKGGIRPKQSRIVPPRRRLGKDKLLKRRLCALASRSIVKTGKILVILYGQPLVLNVRMLIISLLHNRPKRGSNSLTLSHFTHKIAVKVAALPMQGLRVICSYCKALEHHHRDVGSGKPLSKIGSNKILPLHLLPN